MGALAEAGAGRSGPMFLSQAVADLQLLLAGVTTPEHARDMVHDALKRSGLSREPLVTEAELRQLLAAIAAEGGVVTEIAEQLAMRPGLDDAITSTIEAATGQAATGDMAATTQASTDAAIGGAADAADSKPGISPGRSAV